jgi:hypothetical protein
MIFWLAACNDAPLWPDDAYSPGGEVPWSHPSDVACSERDDDDAVEIDGYQYCGDEIAFDLIVAVDDPIYRSCADASPDAARVMAVFDGVRARAFVLAALDLREIVHTEWGGEDVLVTYCPIIAGGDVFHREVDGRSVRFDVAGLWGSANTVTPREEHVRGDYTVYTTWDGHALLGPGRPGAIEPLGVLVDYPTLAEFLERYTPLGSDCSVWLGDEELGVGCDDACAHRGQVCGEVDASQCLRECEDQPRAWSDCLSLAETCDEQRRCTGRVYSGSQ